MIVNLTCLWMFAAQASGCYRKGIILVYFKNLRKSLLENFARFWRKILIKYRAVCINHLKFLMKQQKKIIFTNLFLIFLTSRFFLPLGSGSKFEVWGPLANRRSRRARLDKSPLHSDIVLRK